VYIHLAAAAGSVALIDGVGKKYLLTVNTPTDAQAG